MLSFLSVNVGHDPVFRASEIARGGFNAVRIVLQRKQYLNTYIKECHSAGVKVIGQIAKESLWFPDETREMSPGEAAAFYAGTYCRKELEIKGETIDALSVLNEADGDSAKNPESWCLSPQDADTYLRAFLVGVRSYNDKLPLHAVGTVTGQPDYVRKLDQTTLKQYDALDVHCYAQWPDTVGGMLLNYEFVGMPIVCHEFGWPHPDPYQRGKYIRDMVHSYEDLGIVDGVGVYCWDLVQHSQPFGVVDHGNFTAAIPWIQSLGYKPFPNLLPLTPPKTIGGSFISGLGFEKWAVREPDLIGEAIGNDESNVAPGWQTQATTKGVIAWVEGKGHSFVTYPDNDGNSHIYRWHEDWTESVQVK